MTETKTGPFSELRKCLNFAKARVAELDDLKRNIVHPRWREDEANLGHLENWQVKSMLEDELEAAKEDAEHEIQAFTENQGCLSQIGLAEFQALAAQFNAIWPAETVPA
jgi:hypothetical protein